MVQPNHYSSTDRGLLKNAIKLRNLSVCQYPIKPLFRPPVGYLQCMSRKVSDLSTARILFVDPFLFRDCRLAVDNKVSLFLISCPTPPHSACLLHLLYERSIVRAAVVNEFSHHAVSSPRSRPLRNTDDVGPPEQTPR